MENILIFPLNSDTQILIDQLHGSTKYKVVAVSSYYEDKKRLEEMQQKYNIYCDCSFDNSLKRVDTVIFANDNMGHKSHGYRERVLMAIEQNKKIYIQKDLLDNLSLNENTKNLYVFQKEQLVDNNEKNNLKEINVPIISIMGLGENCDKFNLQVKVKKIIEDKGFKVLGISSNVMGFFLDMEILPGFLFSKQISYPEKIRAFNYWLYEIQKLYNADVIVMGCPSGILEFEQYESNFYGEIPLVMTNAVDIDAGIITLYANSEQNGDTIQYLKNFVQKKYAVEVNNFVVSSKYYQVNQEWRHITYYNIPKRKPLSYRGTNKIIISCIEEDGSIKKQVDTIVNKLENNFFSI